MALAVECSRLISSSTLNPQRQCSAAAFPLSLQVNAAASASSGATWAAAGAHVDGCRTDVTGRVSNFMTGWSLGAGSTSTVAQPKQTKGMTWQGRVRRASTRAEASAVAVPEVDTQDEASPTGDLPAVIPTSSSKVTPNVEEASSTASEEAKKAKKKVTSKLRRNKDWERANDLLQNGKIYKARVEALNDGGARVRFGSLLAFLPFSQMTPRTAAPGANKFEGLVGSEIEIQVIEVKEASGRLLVSERTAFKRRRLEELQVGQVWDGKVSSTTDYGAFVDLYTPQGKELGVGGLVHMSELSWDALPNPAAAMEKGQDVKVKILRLDRSKGRLALSMKQVESDPIYTTLDTLLRSSSTGASQPLAEELLGAPLPGLQDLCDTLRKQNGILEVSLGRQALEPRVVSQDLELWLSNVPAKDGQYTLVARAGRQVQEVFVKSSLDRDGMKQAVLTVSQAMP